MNPQDHTAFAFERHRNPLRRALTLMTTIAAIGACATPTPSSPIDQVLQDADAENISERTPSEALARLRWRATTLRQDTKAGYAGRELALVDTWLAAATAMSVMPDRDEAHYVLLLDATAATLGSIQALYGRLDAEARLEKARLNYVQDRAALVDSSKEGRQ